VHALLAYLRATGFEGAPRPLGIDEDGREVLSFISGTVPWPDRFGLLASQQRLARAARLIREFHDAVTGFAAAAGARWQVLIPAEGEPEIIAHHDLAPLESGDRPAIGVHLLGSGGTGNAAVGRGLCRAWLRPVAGQPALAAP
jgi:hypothetical protein